jgi:hypothetical protein
MAGLTHVGTVDMAGRQTVAAGTGAGTIHLRVIHGNDRCPARGAVTRFTDISAIDVTAGQAVATGTGAGTVDLRVIHGNDWCPA